MPWVAGLLVTWPIFKNGKTKVVTFDCSFLNQFELCSKVLPLWRYDLRYFSYCYIFVFMVWPILLTELNNPEGRRFDRDTSDAPVNITNKIGMIFLRKGGLTTNCASHSVTYHLTLTLILWSCIVSLASNFSILLGRIGVEVPHVETGSDYQVVCEYFSVFFSSQSWSRWLVFGDSGNFSPFFTITNA